MEKIGNLLDNIDQAKYDQQVREILSDVDVQAFLSEQGLSAKDAVVAQGINKLGEFYRAKKGQGLSDDFTPRLVFDGFIDIAYVKKPGIKANAHFLDIPKAVKSANFKEFQITDARVAAIQAASDFVKNFDRSKLNKGLYLYGSYGTGKTYLMGAIANSLAEKGIESTLVFTTNLIEEMNKRMFSQDKNDLPEYVERLRRVDVLMLDDIGAERVSDWVIKQLFDILNYRYQEELATCFTSNLTLNQLEERFIKDNKDGSDTVSARRLMERIRVLAREVELSGADRREF
ncbi:MAG: primosomal protein DnaI [Lactobacillales bacterium]|jgi:primosomal protein DnaI|nr:primosomal protein DnaI [Lactobacillales bacterium]